MPIFCTEKRSGEYVVRLLKAEPVRLRFFVDRSVIELFVNDGKHVASRVFERLPEGKGIELFAEGGTACFEKIKIWQICSIW